MNTATLTNGNTSLQPAFVNVEACHAWLELQPLASAVQMQSLLQRQLGLLNRYALSGVDRLDILEILREPVYTAQEGSQSRFSGRPLPLAPPEQAALESALATWTALADGYTLCLESLLHGETVLQEQAALIVQRILSTFVDMQLSLYRSGHFPKVGYWQNMHRCLSSAEQLGVTLETVADHLRHEESPVTVVSAYAEAMLLHAAQPLRLGQKHMSWVSRWARRWAGKVNIDTTATDVDEAGEESAAPLYVLLGSDAPASHTKPDASDKLRVLNTKDLRRSLKKRLHMLARGDSPASMHLGDDCVQPACEKVLDQAYRNWCKPDDTRRHERRSSQDEHTVYCGIDNVHQILLGGKPFHAPGQVDVNRLRIEREELAMFGMVRDPVATGTFVVTPSERWVVLDHSVSGMRLQRQPTEGQSRLAAGMLLSVQMGSTDFLLGVIRWVVLYEGGVMEIGITLIPGKPRPVSVGAKAMGTNKAASHARAMLLPAIPALKEASSLILPIGWFTAGRVIDLYDDGAHLIRLGQAMERGADFDRITFSDMTTV